MKLFPLFLVLVLVGGCETLGVILQPVPGKKPGPPAHAPAHGRRAKDAMTYHYFPGSQVYFNPANKKYHWLAGDSWKSGATLPRNLSSALGEHLILSLTGDSPQAHHSRILKKHPPKKGSGKNKKGKGPKKGKKK